jgi:Fur family transcriptional regulator, ferric uptake regulator
MTTPPASAATASSLEDLCARKGLRMTGQRRTIARILDAASDHPNVEELHRRAVAVDDRISISTVYRTVKLFEDMDIIARRAFGDGRARYETAAEPHHDHLIDVKSGRVIEFHDDRIERLQEAIAAELGYRLVDHKLELYGVPLARPGDGRGGKRR